MVRVLKCHHFSYQEVFTPHNEPHVIHTTQDQVFVATSSCYIEVHSLEEHGCPLVLKFPTISTVKQLTYSLLDNYITTIEEPASDEDHDVVRVYVNWQLDRNDQPMRVKIAGHLTSLRHQEGPDVQPRFEVIEIPLKSNPRCIASNISTGALGIGVDQSFLLYGFCSKVVARTHQTYRDMKCLLELTLTFPVRSISLCEEFVACGSHNEIQVIQLKGYKPPTPTPDVTMDHPLKRNIPELAYAEISELRLARQKSYSPSLSQISIGSAPGRQDSNEYIVDDEYHMTWSFDDSDDDKPMMPASEQVRRPFFASRGAKLKAGTHPAKLHNRKTIILKSMRHHQSAKQHQMVCELQTNGVLFGPVEAPPDCSVSVEYEDVCSPEQTPLGYLSNTVLTYLFRKFGADTCIHSLQLKPVYRGGVIVPSASSCPDCSSWSVSSRRQQLIGMYCFVSTPSSGELYKVSGKPQKLATYSYTAAALQCCLTDSLVYVATDNALEVYPSRCLTSAMHDVSSCDNISTTLPSTDLEICLLGLQPFIGPQYIAVSEHMVVILSKHVADGLGTEEEVNWSVYALKMPSAIELYKDMIELVLEYVQTSIGIVEIIHLLREAFLLLKGYQFVTNDQDLCVRDHLRSVSARLGHFHSRPNQEEWRLSLPYYIMAGISVEEVVQKAVFKANSRGIHSKGLMLFLNHVLFLDRPAVQVSQEMGSRILEIYADMEPRKLSSVILKSRLHTYNTERALEILHLCMEDQEDHHVSLMTLNVLAKVALHLQQGDQAEAEAALFSINMNDLLKACISNPEILHVGYDELTPLTQMLRRHKLPFFLRVFHELLIQSVISLETAILLLIKGPGENPGTNHNPHVMMLLERVLNDKKCKSLFTEAARTLVDIYLYQLSQPVKTSPAVGSAKTINDILPRGTGHFSKRYSWLDNVPPFQGEQCLWKPCIHTAPAMLPKSLSSIHHSSNTQRLRRVSSDFKRDTSCSCCWCNATLLKLQSLLCYQHACENLYMQILTSLERATEVKGHDSLWLLAMTHKDPAAAVNVLLGKYPAALPGFTGQVGRRTKSMWSLSIRSLLATIKAQELASSPHHQVENPSVASSAQNLQHNVTVLKEILSMVVDVTTPEEFLQFLPDDASSRFFLPYLAKSYQRHSAQSLKQIIIEKSQTLSGVA